MLVADIETSKCATFKEINGNGPIAIISQGNIAIKCPFCCQILTKIKKILTLLRQMTVCNNDRKV